MSDTQDQTSRAGDSGTNTATANKPAESPTGGRKRSFMDALLWAVKGGRDGKKSMQVASGDETDE